MICLRVAAACALLLLAAIAPLRAQSKPASAPDRLDLRFANGIAAIVEDKIITVDDIRREISPLVPTLQKEARNEKEFNEKLEALQDDIIQNLIDRVLIVKEFNKVKDGDESKKRQVPASVINRTDQLAPREIKMLTISKA